MDDKKKKEIDSVYNEEQYKTIVGVPNGVDVRKSVDYNPLSYLGTWDFIVVFLAVFLRFLVETNLKAVKIENIKGETFQFIKYFDFKHSIRWVMHLISCVLGLIILPEIFINYVYEKYEIGITDWTLFGSGVVGFVGYDMLRVLEKVFLAILNKTVGYKPDEK